MSPPGVSVWIDDVRVADGSTVGEEWFTPFAVDGLTVTWGRPTTLDQPAPSTCTFQIHATTLAPDPDLFGQTVTLGRRVDVWAGYPVVHVFTGSITDVRMVASDDDPTVLVLSVTADDVLADLANRPAATGVRPIEGIQARALALIAAARTQTGFTVSTDVAATPVARITADDAQTEMVATLLTDIAASVDGVLWSTVDAAGEAALWLESPAMRTALRRLALVPPWVTIVDASFAAGALAINPCVPDLAPVEFAQSMSDVVTGVTVTYRIPDPADPTVDVDVTTTVVDPGVENPSRAWGVRRLELGTLLTTLLDAQTVAGKVLVRLASPTWRITNLTVDAASTPTLSDADWRRLLDMRTRAGLPVIIAPLPPWAPPDSESFTGYVEGGEFTSTGGQWLASLYVSLATGYGASSVRWMDLTDADTWQWQDFDPDMSWADLAGVGAPV